MSLLTKISISKNYHGNSFGLTSTHFLGGSRKRIHIKSRSWHIFEGIAYCGVYFIATLLRDICIHLDYGVNVFPYNELLKISVPNWKGDVVLGRRGANKNSRTTEGKYMGWLCQWVGYGCGMQALPFNTVLSTEQNDNERKGRYSMALFSHKNVT